MMSDDGVTQLETKMRNLGYLAEDATIELPKIVLVGGDKVGKSSLIESLVQRDIFCKEERETCRPVIIKMEQSNEPPDFVQLEYPDKVKSARSEKSMEYISEEIENWMSKNTKDNSALSLKISASQVTEELTFIDMPSISKLLQTKTNEFVKWCDYHKNVDSVCDWELCLEDENNLILAVFAANDIDGFESTLGFVHEFDPDGIRTIGVVTMLDVTPANQELTDILTNCKNPLKRGYYGVINRNQENTNNDSDIQVTRHCEQRFFDGHPIYGRPQLRNRMGADNLAPHVMHLIFECRKVLLRKIESEIENEPSACASISDMICSSRDTVKGICGSCWLPFIDESTMSEGSAMTSAIVSSREAEVQFDNGEGLTVEIILEGLQSVTLPTIDGDMVAVEGPNYKIAISSPGAKRKAAVVKPGSCYFTADECTSSDADSGNKYIDDDTQNRNRVMKALQRIRPWENVMNESCTSCQMAAKCQPIDSKEEDFQQQSQRENEANVGYVEDLAAPLNPVFKLTAEQGLNEAVTSKTNTYNDGTQYRSLENKLSTDQRIGPSEYEDKEPKVSFILPANSVKLQATDNKEEDFQQQSQPENEANGGYVEDPPAPPNSVFKLTAEQGLNESVTSKKNTYNDGTQYRSLENKLSTDQRIGPSEYVEKEPEVSFILPANSAKLQATDNIYEEVVHQMQLGNESAGVVVLIEEDLAEQTQADLKQNEDVDPCNQCGEFCDLLNPDAAVVVEVELNADGGLKNVVCRHQESQPRFQTSEEPSSYVTDCYVPNVIPMVESVSDTDISSDDCTDTGVSMTLVSSVSQELGLVRVCSDMYQLPNSFEDRQFVEESLPFVKGPGTNGPPVPEPNAEPRMKLDIVQEFWAYADENKDCHNPDENTACGNRDNDSCDVNIGSVKDASEFRVDSPLMSPSSSSSSLSSYSSACSNISE